MKYKEEHTEQHGAGELNNAAQDACGAQREHLRADRRSEVVGGVVAADGERENEGHYKRQDHHPEVRRVHLGDVDEADRMVHPVRHLCEQNVTQ